MGSTNVCVLYTEATHLSNQSEGPFVNSFLMTRNLVQADEGLCMNVFGGGGGGLFFAFFAAKWSFGA